MGLLTDDMTRLSGEIAASRDSRIAFTNDLKSLNAERVTGFREDHSIMSDEMKGRLMAFAADLRATVSEMLTVFREDHSRMSDETKGWLGVFVSDLRNTVSEMLTGFRETQTRLSEDIKSDLSAFISDLKDTVDGFRGEVRADMAGARRAWTGASHAEPKIAKSRVAKTRVAKPKVEPKIEEPEVIESVMAEEVEIPVEEKRDDLTSIQGVGKGMQERLNEAGLYSFAQVARSSPDILCDALGNLARLANVETWIEQAKELAEE